MNPFRARLADENSTYRFYRSSDYGSCSNAQINHPAPAIATGDRLVDHKSQALGYGTPLSGFSSTSFSRTNGDSSSRGLLSNESTSPGYGSFASSSQEDTIQPTVTPQALRRNVSPPGGSYSSHTNLATRGPGDLGTDPLAAVGGRFSGVNSTGQYERNGNQDQHLGINGVSKRPIGNSTYPGSSTSTNEVSWFPTVNIGGLSDYPARFPAFNPQRSYQGGTLSSTRSPSLGDLPQESPNLQEPHNSRLMPLNETSPYYAFTTGGQVLFSARSSGNPIIIPGAEPNTSFTASQPTTSSIDNSTRSRSSKCSIEDAAICPYCGAVASRAKKQGDRMSNLNRHIRDKHERAEGAKPTCPVPDCGKTFERSDYIHRHMRKSHGSINTSR